MWVVNCLCKSQCCHTSQFAFPTFSTGSCSLLCTHTHTHTQTCSVILVRTTYRPPLFYIRLMICPNSTPNPKHHPHKNMIQLFMILTRDVWLTSRCSTCFTILVRTCFNREDILDLTTWTKLLKLFGQKLLHATSSFIYSVQHSRNVDIFLKLPVSHCTHSFTRTYTQCYLNSCVCSLPCCLLQLLWRLFVCPFSLSILV